MADFGRIGQGLQGFSAGVAGQLPQFQAGLRADQEREEKRRSTLSLERRQAGATDFRNINQNLKAGLTDRALSQLNNRALAIGESGDSDTRETDLVRGMIEAGQIQDAIKLLDAVERESVNLGLLTPQQQPKSKVVGDFLVNESTGKVMFDASGQGPEKTAKDANGFLRFVGGENSGKRVFPEVVKIEEQLTGESRLNQAKSIRAEISKANSDFTDIANAWDRIAASSNDPSAAGDLALIFNFMKMLDPGSTVREGEFATAANSAGVPDRIRASFNRVKNGERLAIAQRTDFLNQAQNIFNKSSDRAVNITDEFVRVAEMAGLTREEVVIKRGAAPVIGTPQTAQAPAAPQAPSQAPTQVFNFDAQGNPIQ